MSATIIMLPIIPNISGEERQAQRQRERDEPMRSIRFRACPRLIVTNKEVPARRRPLPSVFVKRMGS